VVLKTAQSGASYIWVVKGGSGPGGGYGSLPLYFGHLVQDVQPPHAGFDAAPSGGVPYPEATFVVEVDKPGSTVEYSLDVGPWQEMTTFPEMTITVDPGSHTLQIRAVDKFGHVQLDTTSPANFAHWTYDPGVHQS